MILLTLATSESMSQYTAYKPNNASTGPRILMEDRAQRILAAILGTKLLARWVQGRSFTSTSIASGNLLTLSKQQTVDRYHG